MGKTQLVKTNKVKFRTGKLRRMKVTKYKKKIKARIVYLCISFNVIQYSYIFVIWFSLVRSD
jgi:hypothetical protein